MSKKKKDTLNMFSSLQADMPARLLFDTKDDTNDPLKEPSISESEDSPKNKPDKDKISVVDEI